mgnify:CR=1 FL=1
MLVLIGPSASGKTEVANILIKKYQLRRMVTYTTRPIRINEINGVSYNFVSVDKFIKLKEMDAFVETVYYNGNYYGTLKKDVSNDKIVILEPNGFNEFKKKMPNAICSFYLETSEKVREQRMKERKDKEEDIEKRIINDRKSFENVLGCDYVIENENITLEELADKIYNIYKEKKMKVLVETSARHVHLTEETFKTLFGENAELTVKKYLSQPGQFASEQRINVIGPKKAIANVSILGPFRKDNQVELSGTDARSIGLPVVIRESGDIKGTPGCILEGPCGKVEISEGVIVAKRHIHMTSKDAQENGFVDKQIVSVKIENDVRSTVFGDVVVRVRDDFALAMHIDTDESNAAAVAPGYMAEVIK